MERRLAAIMAADVVGYSRLMELDEVGTLAALKTPCGQETRPRSWGELGMVRKHPNEACGAGGLRIYSDPSRVGPIRDQ